MKGKVMMKAMIAAAVLTLAVPSLQARAEWPERPIKMIVPFPAGSSSDTVGRIVAAKMAEGLGQQVIVENRPGGSMVATAHIAVGK
jgi:tripartite-type tricarboxylate transporter receptor subunit TctC